MVQLSLLQKLKLFMNIILSSKIFIGVLFSLMILFTLSVTKKNKITIIITYIFMFLSSLIFLKNYKAILNLINYLIDGIFSIIYFPDFYIYILLTIIISVIITLVIYKNIGTLIKNISIFTITIIYFLNFIILDIVLKNNIDITLKTKIYSNNEMLNLIQFNTLIYLIYIFTLLLILIIRKIKIRYSKEDIEIIDVDDIDIIDEEDIEILDI